MNIFIETIQLEWNIFSVNRETTEYYDIISCAINNNIATICSKNYENHHIIPKCFFIKYGGWIDGDPDNISNLVYLTIDEHVRCHFLLPDMVKPDSRAYWLMIHALTAMKLNRDLTEEQVIEYKKKSAELHNSELYKNKQRHDAQKRWADQQFRDKMLSVINDPANSKTRGEAISVGLNAPEIKKKHKNSLKKAWENTEIRDKHMVIRQSSVYKKNQAISTKNSWKNPKIRENHTNAANEYVKNNPPSKPFICIETGEIFNNMSKAGRVLQISKSSISRVLKHPNKNLSAGGYHFKYI